MNKFKIISILVIFVFMFGFVMPQPAEAGMWDSVKSVASSAVSAVKDTATSAYNSVKNTVTSAVSTVKNTAVSAYNSVKDGIKGAISSVTGSVTGGGGIKETITGAVKSIGGSAASKISDKIKEIAGGAEGALSKLSGLPAGLSEKITGSIGVLKDLFGKEAEGIVGSVKDKITDFAEKLGIGSDSFSEKVSGLLEPNSLIEKFKGLVAKHPLADRIKDIQENLVNMTGSATDILKDKMGKIPGLVDKAGKGLADKAKGFLARANMTKDGVTAAIYDTSKKVSGLSKIVDNPVAFDKKMKEVFKNSSETANSKTSSSLSFGGVKFEGMADIYGRANDDINKNQAVFRGEAYLGPKLESKATLDYLDGRGKLEASTRNVLGLDAVGEGNIRWMKDGDVVSAKGNAHVVAGFHSENKVRNQIQLSENFANDSSAVLDVVAGADAKAKGTAYHGENGIELGASAEARVGIWADAAGSTSMDYKGESLFSAKGNAGAGLGLGAGAGAGASFRLDRLGFEGKVTLGPFKLGGGVYVNPKAIGQLAYDKGGQAVSYVADKGRAAADKVGDAAKATGNFFKSGASKVGGWVGSLW